MGINAEYMGTHPIFESDFDCLTEMKLFVLTYFATGALGRAKDIKQEMMKNRLKFDRDIVLTSPDDDEELTIWTLGSLYFYQGRFSKDEFNKLHQHSSDVINWKFLCKVYLESSTDAVDKEFCLENIDFLEYNKMY